MNLSAIFRVKDVGFEVVGGLKWEVITSNTVASAGKGYLIDTSGGAVTLTLPASMAINESIGIKDLKGSFSTNNLTIARNGNNIQGLAEDFIGDVDNMAVNLTYTDVTTGIAIVNGAW